jgi:hypothetical protein
MYFRKLEETFLECVLQNCYDWTTGQDSSEWATVAVENFKSVLTDILADALLLSTHQRKKQADLYSLYELYPIRIEKLRNVFIKRYATATIKAGKDQQTAAHRIDSLTAAWPTSIESRIFEECLEVYKNTQLRLLEILEPAAGSARNVRSSFRKSPFFKLIPSDATYTAVVNKLLELEWVEESSLHWKVGTEYIHPLINHLFATNAIPSRNELAIATAFYDTFKPNLSIRQIRRFRRANDDSYNHVKQLFNSIEKPKSD